MFQEYYLNRGAGQIPKEKEQLSDFRWFSSWIFLSYQQPGPRGSQSGPSLTWGTVRRAGPQLHPRPAEGESAFWQDAQVSRMRVQGWEALVFRLQPWRPPRARRQVFFSFVTQPSKGWMEWVAPPLGEGLGKGREQEEFRTLLAVSPQQVVAREVWGVWLSAAPHLGFKITFWLKKERKEGRKRREPPTVTHTALTWKGASALPSPAPSPLSVSLETVTEVLLKEKSSGRSLELKGL